MSDNIQLNLSETEVVLIITALLCIPNNVASQNLIAKIIETLSSLDEG